MEIEMKIGRWYLSLGWERIWRSIDLCSEAQTRKKLSGHWPDLTCSSSFWSKIRLFYTDEGYYLVNQLWWN